MLALDSSFIWSAPARHLIRAVTYIFPILLLMVIIFQPWEDPKLIFLDVLVAAEVAAECCSVSFGFISQIGIFLWLMTAAICLFCSVFMLIGRYNRSLVYFAFSAGVLTGWLGLDDAFLLHEKVLPALGVPQTAVLLTYVFLTGIYVVLSWRILFRCDYSLLLVGGAAFVISLAIDIILHTPLWINLEDSAKFLGICCWTSFHITSLLKIILLGPKVSNLS